MKFDKILVDYSLIYVPSWKHARWDLNNLTQIICTLEHAWDPSSINKASKVKAVLQNNKRLMA